MTLSDLLPPERVREIAQQYAPPYGSMTELRMDAINTAMPEIARAVLETAAKRFDEMLWRGAAEALRQMAKEITNAD